MPSLGHSLATSQIQLESGATPAAAQTFALRRNVLCSPLSRQDALFSYLHHDLLLLVPTLPSVWKFHTSSLIEFTKCTNCVRTITQLLLCMFKRNTMCKSGLPWYRMLKIAVVTYRVFLFCSFTKECKKGGRKAFQRLCRCIPIWF